MISRKVHGMRKDWSARLAGALVIVVGALNLAVGVLSLASDLVLLATGVAGGLVVAGLVTVALGVLVWRGSRNAAIASTTVFTMLLLYQVAEAIASDVPADAMVDQPVPRLVILAVLVVTSAIAAWRLHRSAPAPAD
jgi:Na+/proline symporter